MTYAWQAEGPSIENITLNLSQYEGEQVPTYEKLEITFTVNTIAENLQFPYSATPPNGIKAGGGVTVNALFTPDEWQTVYIQPAFYYQDFIDEIKEGQAWLYPTDEFAWKVRFSPNEEGNWQYKLTVEDASGRYESEAASFSVVPSSNKGFIRVSEADARYFEYDDGSYFAGLGYNFAIFNQSEALPEMSANGIQLIRSWLPSQLSIFGSAWSPWRSHNPAHNSQEPDARLRHDGVVPVAGAIAKPASEAALPSETFLWLSHDETRSSDNQLWDFTPCMLLGWQSPALPLKRNTTYRVRVRYKEEGLTGPKVSGQPFGFTVKVGGWLWGEDESQRCYSPGTGTLLAATYNESDEWSHYPDEDSPGWQILEGRFNSGERDFFDLFYLAIENASAGHLFVDYVWLEEALANDEYGPNVIYKPWMAPHQYFAQRSSYIMDQTVELAKEHDIYLKLVILEKQDYVLNIFEADGSFSDVLPSQREGEPLFFGAGRETDGKSKVRWLQEAWWRYLQARWGYASHIHSWELLNEGDPNSIEHYILADELGKYFQQTFIPAGQPRQHPNIHLVTTSFWHSFPTSFWSSSDYPYVDYADIHHYARQSSTQPLDYIYEVSDFYDAALFSQKLSMQHGAKQADGAAKPVMRGETAFFFDQEDLFAKNATNGLWLHNFVWAGINPGGLLESFWATSETEYQIYRADSHDHRPIFKRFYNFIKDIPLNNGHYEDAKAIVSEPNLRVWGQKDMLNGQAHLWIQNKEHTWKNIYDGLSIAPLSGTVTLEGFQPKTSYAISWWDTYQTDETQQIIGRERLIAQADGSIIIPIENLMTDIALKLYSPQATDEAATTPKLPDKSPDEQESRQASNFSPTFAQLVYGLGALVVILWLVIIVFLLKRKS
jgi:hypothetical protein